MLHMAQVGYTDVVLYTVCPLLGYAGRKAGYISVKVMYALLQLNLAA